jgi:hypothetical protein
MGSTRARVRATGWRIVPHGLWLASLLALGTPTPASASHFRFGHINWTRVFDEDSVTNTARIVLTQAFRRSAFNCFVVTGDTVPCSSTDGLPGVGDVFREDTAIVGTLDFGDGTGTAERLYYRVITINPQEDWLLALALEPGTTREYIDHTYPGPGPYTVSIADCCRIRDEVTPYHINNPDRHYRLEALVDFRTRASPQGLLPPIVDCPRESRCRVEAPIDLRPQVFASCEASPGLAVPGATIAVEARDLPAETSLEVRLGAELVAAAASDSEGRATASFDVPAGTAGGTRPVTVQAVGSAAGAVCALAVGALPVFDSPPTPAEAAVLRVEVGRILFFRVRASDPDSSDALTLQAIGLPSGASFIPLFVTEPNERLFFWRPALGQEGHAVVVFTATDASGLAAPPRTVIIEVTPDLTPPSLDLQVSPTVLWPPDHRLVGLAVTHTVSDGADPAPAVRLVSAVSSEPDDAPGGGDGHTTGDVEVSGDFEIRLRAQRSAHGPGRVYTLTWQAEDAAGNLSEVVRTVKVPRHR